MDKIDMLFYAYCSKKILCHKCKYDKDKRVINGMSCNEAYRKDYEKRFKKECRNEL